MQASRGAVSDFLVLGFSIATILFILFLILTFIHFTMYPIFSFSPNDTAGIISIPTASDRKDFFTKAPAASDQPLLSSTNVTSCGYTLGFDTYLNREFTEATLPRVLLYRSLAVRSIQESSALLYTSDLPEKQTYLMSTFPDTNLLLWLDPVQNTMYLSVIGSLDGTSAGRAIKTSPPVDNLPLEKVFRTTLVFGPNHAEIYINGKLKMSYPFGDIKPVEIASTNLFAVAKRDADSRTNFSLGSVSYWPRLLTPAEVASYESVRADAKFFTGA